MRFCSISAHVLSTLALVAPIIAGPLPETGSGLGRTYVPSVDERVDRHSVSNLVPSLSLDLQYAEVPQSRHGLTLEFNMTMPAVVLENCASIATYHCSSDATTLKVSFERQEAFSIASSWPQSDMVLITNEPGCNADDERGIYLVHGFVSLPAESIITFQVEARSWKDVATTMRITYGGAVPVSVEPDASPEAPASSGLMKQEKRDTAPGAPLSCHPRMVSGPWCGVDGYLVGKTPDFIAVPTGVTSFTGCRDACIQNPQCHAMGFNGTNCINLKRQIQVGWHQQSPGATYRYYNRQCFQCTTSTPTDPTSSPVITPSGTPTNSGLGFEVTQPTTLDEAQLSLFTSFTAGITYNTDGVIVGSLPSSLASPTSAVAGTTANPSNTASQAARQSLLSGDGLPDFGTLAQNALAALSGADTPPPPAAAPASRHKLVKRYSFGDFLDDCDTYACNDLATSLSETLDDACDAKDGAEAIYCFATSCYQQSANAPPPPPPTTQYTFDYKWNINIPGFTPGYVYSNGNSYLSCESCSINIQNLEYTGTINVVLANSQLLSAAITVTQSSLANLVFGLFTYGADTGGWNYILYNNPLDQIKSGTVFTISPTLLFGIGANWTTSGPSNFTAGASMTLSGASLFMDLVQESAGDSQNWAPSTHMTYPQFSGPTTFTPYYMTSVQTSAVILGNQLTNAAALTTQTNMGFSSSLVTIGKAAGAQCPAGQYASSSFLSAINAIAFNGQPHIILSTGLPSSVSCATATASAVSPSQVSALSSASGGPAFCTSYIGYIPRKVTTTASATVTSPSTTSTKTARTKTVRLPVAVSTTTVVFTQPIGQKREVPITAAIPALAPRQAVPTPSIVSDWVPAQVSAACSSIATGTTQVTSTSTITVLNGKTTVTVTPTVTASQRSRTVTTTVTVPAVTPSNVVQNPNFNAASQFSSFGEPPPSWSLNGAIWDNDCSGGDEFYDFGPCQDPLAQLPSTVYTLLSQDADIDAHEGDVSQTLNGLYPGLFYQFGINAGYDNSANTCTVNYSLDGNVFRSYSPVNTYDSSQNQIRMPFDGLYSVQATAQNQVLKIGMSCPNAGDNGGVAFWSNVTFTGPFASPS